MQTTRSELNPNLVYKIHDVVSSAKSRFKYLLQLGTVWVSHSDISPASSEGFAAVWQPRSSSPEARPHGGPEAAQATQTHNWPSVNKLQYININIRCMYIRYFRLSKVVFAQISFNFSQSILANILDLYNRSSVNHVTSIATYITVYIFVQIVRISKTLTTFWFRKKKKKRFSAW